VAAGAAGANSALANDQSGQTMAVALMVSLNEAARQSTVENFSASGKTALDDFARGGDIATTFEDLRSQTGTATYNSNGHVLAPVSGGGGAGDYNLVLSVDFPARSLFVVFFYNIASGPNAVSNSVGGSSSFATGSGTFSLVTANNCGLSGFACTGTLGFRNSGGTVAAQAVHTMTVAGNGAVSQGNGITDRTNVP
jgi:hypothetical protein